MTDTPMRGLYRVNCPHCGWLGIYEEHSRECPRFPIALTPAPPTAAGEPRPFNPLVDTMSEAELDHIERVMTGKPTPAKTAATEQGEVTQADHGAAYDLAEAMGGRSAGECLATVIPKAMMRHRTTSLRTLEAEVLQLEWLIDRERSITIEWRNRATAAEAREKVLREALEKIANNNWRDQSRAKSFAKEALSPKEPS